MAYKKNIYNNIMVTIVLLCLLKRSLSTYLTKKKTLEFVHKLDLHCGQIKSCNTIKIMKFNKCFTNLFYFT